MIYRCSKCGKEYNQLKQLNIRSFPNVKIYYTHCCDTASIELMEVEVNE